MQAYSNSAPEAVPVTVHNNAISISLGTGAEWRKLLFQREHSVGQNGYQFFWDDASNANAAENCELADHAEIDLFVDNVSQAAETFTVAADGLSVTLLQPIEEGQVVRVHALMRITEA